MPTEIFPQPSGCQLQKAGGVYGMNCAATETAIIQGNATAAIAPGDVLRFSGNVVVFDGDPITARHNLAIAGTITGTGPFSFDLTASSSSSALRFMAGFNLGSANRHVIAAPSVILNP